MGQLQLGLPAAPPPTDSVTSAQNDRIFLVIDFEATCDMADDRLTRLQQCQLHEIIEFPCVVIDGAQLTEVASFREFVRPQEGLSGPGGSRVLSEFCSRLTGISQADVESAAPLAEVLARFEAWLVARNLNDAVADGRAVLVTHGEWDLGDQLRLECARKGITVPLVLREPFVDIKVPFSEVVGSGTSINQMLTALGLRASGRPHSGIDDSRNIAQVVAALVRRGGSFDPTHRYQGGDGRVGGELLFLRKVVGGRAGDWECPTCCASCFGRNATCYRCGAAKPDGAPPPTDSPPAAAALPGSGLPRRAGDWDCNACGAMVFSTRFVCFRCGAPKQSLPPPPGRCAHHIPVAAHPGNAGGQFGACAHGHAYQSSQVPGHVPVPVAQGGAGGGGDRRVGDWDCFGCGAMNFASRQQCFRCNGSKPAPVAPGNRPGDWVCASCNAVVFASRPACFRCGVSKPAPTALGRRVGDWDCGSCGAMVFASRQQCFRCGVAKGGAPASAGGQPGGQASGWSGGQ